MRLFLVALLAVTAFGQSQPPAPTPGKSNEANQHKAGPKESKGQPDNRSSDNQSSPVDQPLSVIATGDQQNFGSQRENKTPTDWWARASTVLITLFTLALAVLAYLQWDALSDQHKAMREQANHMREGLVLTRQTADAATLNAKTAINAERAWLRVWLDRIDGNNTRRNVVAMNEGKTPARVTGFQVRTKRVWLDKSEFRHPNVPLDPVNVWVNPKAAEKVGEIDILDLATESSEGKASMGSVLQYHGVVEYIAIIEIDDSGMFPKRHCTSFVYQSSNGSLHERKDLASYT